MVDLTPAERVTRAGQLLIRILQPFLAENAPQRGQLNSWLLLLQEQDKMNGKPRQKRSVNDTRLLLLIFVRYWQQFRIRTKPTQTQAGRDLQRSLNIAAHEPYDITFETLVAFLGTAVEFAKSLDLESEIIPKLQSLHHEAMRDLLGQHSGPENEDQQPDISERKPAPATASDEVNDSASARAQAATESEAVDQRVATREQKPATEPASVNTPRAASQADESPANPVITPEPRVDATPVDVALEPIAVEPTPIPTAATPVPAVPTATPVPATPAAALDPVEPTPVSPVPTPAPAAPSPVSAVATPVPVTSTPVPVASMPTVNTHNALGRREGRELKNELSTKFAPRIPGTRHGLSEEIIAVGDLTMILFFRSELNFALVHNEIGVFAGLGIVSKGETPETDIEITNLEAKLSTGKDKDPLVWHGPQLELESGSDWWAEPSDLAWALPADRFLDLNEAAASQLEVQFDLNGQRVERSFPVRLLAHNQWTPGVVPETIAAFIQPNAEAISSVLSDAAELLKERTGSASMLGYQDTKDRVRATAEAIFDAIRAREIRYSEPPASFEIDGQKVRSAQEVLATRFGTCLDTTLLFASAFAQAGLQAWVLLLENHSIVGYTLHEINTDMVLKDEESLGNLFGSEILEPIETTLATDGSTASFADAVLAGHQRAGFAAASVLLGVNVSAAHRRIRPLPTLVEREGERSIHVVEHVPAKEKSTRTQTGQAGQPGQTADGASTLRGASGQGANPAANRTGTSLALKASQAPRRVQRWQTDLLDLSLRNPLLKLSDARGVSFLVPDEDLEELENRLAESQSIQLTPHESVDEFHQQQGLTSASQYATDQLSRLFLEEERTYVRAQRGNTLNKLTQLRRDANSARVETGASALYVSLGLLKWTSNARSGTKQQGRSPLFLLPVEITGSKSKPYVIRKDATTDLQPNYCLIEKLRQEYNLTLPWLEEPPTDDAGIDLARVFREMREFFVDKNLDFSIEARAHLGIFQFASIDMWRDVSENWQQFESNAVVDHLVNHPTELFKDPVELPDNDVADELESFLPLPADGSQLGAVKAASAGRSFALEGPPGTGKSQTIANMIADGIAKGRTILFVAEKQAALSVVHDRLKRVGLEPLVLDLHGKSRSINQVREQLKRSKNAVATGNPQAFEAARARLNSLTQQLGRYPEQLHSGGSRASESGAKTVDRSVWGTYQRCLQLEKNYPASASWRPEELSLTNVALERDPVELRRIAENVDLALQRTGGLRLAQEWAFIGQDDAATPASELLAAAMRVIARLAHLPAPLVEMLEQLDQSKYGTLSTWLESLNDILGIGPNAHGPVQGADRPLISSVEIEARAGEAQQFRTRWNNFADTLTPAALHADVASLKREYEEALRAGLFRRGKLTDIATAKISANIRPELLEHAGTDWMRFLNDLGQLQLEHGMVHQRVTQGIPQAAPHSLLSEEFARAMRVSARLAQSFEAHDRATRTLLEILPQAGEKLTVISRIPQTKDANLYSAVSAFFAELETLEQVASATADSVTRWRADETLVARIRECASVWSATASDAARGAEFQRQVDLHRALAQAESAGLGDVANGIRQSRDAKYLAETVDLAIERALLKQQLQKQDLDVFDADRHRENVVDYIRQTEEMRELLRTELPARLLEPRMGSEPIGAGLLRELERRRGGSIRRLFTDHWQDILRLTPVLLMSPSSVARFLPPGPIRFDTVIFDEASQVKVADAVGALGRADAAVIVGDSKQMPPTAMFSVGADSDEEEESTEVLATAKERLESKSPATATIILDAAPTDQESILSEAIGAGLERRWLSWHYRSKHESLISFSNVKYYEGNLQVFPVPPAEHTEKGVSIRFIDGEFDRGKTRTNRAEALAIVEEVTAQLEAKEATSIGVVTFNTQQRDLILDLLEQSDSAVVRRALEREEEPVFVKNLENVQGDERDVILFSIAFAPDPETNVLNHNFGPLNNVGGERRLNVAITRARESVILFSSIYASDIREEKTRAEGLLHLKEYLSQAELGKATEVVRSDYAHTTDLYREELAQALQKAGLEVQKDIGTSKFRVDLAVRSSDQHDWLGLLVDSPEWSKRASTSDRESLPSNILEGVMGWQGTLQTYLAGWLKDKEGVVQSIVDRAETMPLVSVGVDASGGLPAQAELGALAGLAAQSGLAAQGGLDAPASVDASVELDAGVASGASIEDPSARTLATTSASAPERSIEAVQFATSATLATDVDQVGRASTQESENVPSTASAADSTALETEAQPNTVDMTGAYPFVEASDERVGEREVLDGYRQLANRRLIAAALEDVIETEGPISTARLTKIVANRFDLSRVQGNRGEEIRSCSTRRPEESALFGDFYWPNNIDPESYSGYRPRNDVDITVAAEHISHREIANAMVAQLRNLGDMTKAELLGETTGVFGWSRAGAKIRGRLNHVMEWAIAKKLIVEQPDGALSAG